LLISHFMEDEQEGATVSLSVVAARVRQWPWGAWFEQSARWRV